MKPENKINMSDISKEVGLHTITCPNCGSKMKGANAINAFFQAILRHCKNGMEVGIWGFGSFRATRIKGRKVKSPLLKDGEGTFKDRLVLRFHQYNAVKGVLNPDKN